MTPEEALEQAALAGIHRLSVDTPFRVGPVNCYLVEGDPLTLVDTGPNSGTTLDALQSQLSAHGHAIDDIELIAITHPHLDHLGLTKIIVEHSGAEVAALAPLAEKLKDFPADADEEDAFAVEIMRRNGIPAEVAEALQLVSSSFRGWGSAVDVTRELADGDSIRLGDREFEVQHRPGHSTTDTLFWDADGEILIVGDHLIAHISSNPLISRPLDGSEGRTRSLIEYVESMKRTRELPAKIVLPGHGEPITDHVELIDARLASIQRREEKIYRLIKEQARTGYELAQAIWGNVAVTQAFLTLSEVIGNADVLVEEGRVREADDGTVIRYEAT
ncbi:MAG TPA: MBL fold metallo-hydrolase [Solirubrobacterales bacterium]|nr:MBL fold metallo-hydrolase [Solirubrobacterales bacterium]